ncbi:MAG: hypothetical protein R6V27_04570 [Balneolaceae bacterium]
MKDEEIIAEINELPVEQRVELLTQIFQGINVPDPKLKKPGPMKPRYVWMNS